jgi:hypothetical protein
VSVRPFLRVYLKAVVLTPLCSCQIFNENQFRSALFYSFFARRILHSPIHVTSHSLFFFFLLFFFYHLFIYVFIYFLLKFHNDSQTNRIKMINFASSTMSLLYFRVFLFWKCMFLYSFGCLHASRIFAFLIPDPR